MDNNVFTVKSLSFAYGKQQVLKNLDLELHEGKITTLIGANGCGKSTLFNLMTKNLRPDEGEIFLREENIAGMKLKDFAREVSIVHQYNTAPVDLSVEKLVGYGRTPYHTMGLSPDPKEDEEKIRRAMEITHTYKHRDKPVSELSGEQKQRVWIAMALAQDTKVLFLDEPTTYLDIIDNCDRTSCVRLDGAGIIAYLQKHDACAGRVVVLHTLCKAPFCFKFVHILFLRFICFINIICAVNFHLHRDQHLEQLFPVFHI